MPVGRPPLWTDPDALNEQIQAYFAECDKGRDEPVVDRKGRPMADSNGVPLRTVVSTPYTVEDLCLYLGCNRSTLAEYAKADKFSHIISHAKQRIRSQWLRYGLSGRYNPKMAALALAAHDPTYRVNQQHELTVRTVEDRLKAVADAELITHDDSVSLPAPDEDSQDSGA